MASNNPSVLVSDLISDVESRLLTPAISSSIYLPWISYAYLRTFNALVNTNQRVKEELFGEVATITMNTTSPNEYTLTDYAERYGGIIKVEVKYGATGDEYIKATRLQSIAVWENQDNVSTTYQSKTQPLYYILGQKIGFIPTPPETGAYAKVWYIKRPYQVTMTSDTIDIPYRFTYPITNYVVAKAIQREHQDYATTQTIEAQFRAELEEISMAAANEYGEFEAINTILVT